jgi:hypothetical protein
MGSSVRNGTARDRQICIDAGSFRAPGLIESVMVVLGTGTGALSEARRSTRGWI